MSISGTFSCIRRKKNPPAARFCQSISLYLSSQLLLRAYHYSWTTWYLDGGQVWDQAHCGWRRMYFYDCLVVVNRDRVRFHNDTNLLSFFEFCHTSMPGGATLFSKTLLTKQKHPDDVRRMGRPGIVRRPAQALKSILHAEIGAQQAYCSTLRNPDISLTTKTEPTLPRSVLYCL